MTAIEFSSLCKDHGFAHVKAGYYRVIGDGIYQVIDTGTRLYIDPSSPWYSNTHRKSKSISIGLWSIYSDLLAFWFDPSTPKGEIEPENIIGIRGIHFFGIQDHYRIMSEIGLDYMDTVKSQAALVEAIKQICLARKNNYFYNEELVIPCLLCGQTELAREIVEQKLGNERMMNWYKDTWPGDPKAKAKENAYHLYLSLKEATENEEQLKKLSNYNMSINLSRIRHFGLPINWDPSLRGSSSIPQRCLPETSHP